MKNNQVVQIHLERISLDHVTLNVPLDQLIAAVEAATGRKAFQSPMPAIVVPVPVPPSPPDNWSYMARLLRDTWCDGSTLETIVMDGIISRIEKSEPKAL